MSSNLRSLRRCSGGIGVQLLTTDPMKDSKIESRVCEEFSVKYLDIYTFTLVPDPQSICRKVIWGVDTSERISYLKEDGDLCYDDGKADSRTEYLLNFFYNLERGTVSIVAK